MSLRTQKKEEGEEVSSNEGQGLENHKQAIKNALHSKGEGLDGLGRHVVNHSRELRENEQGECQEKNEGRTT